MMYQTSPSPQTTLHGPTVSHMNILFEEYMKIRNEHDALQAKYNELQ